MLLFVATVLLTIHKSPSSPEKLPVVLLLGPLEGATQPWTLADILPLQHWLHRLYNCKALDPCLHVVVIPSCGVADGVPATFTFPQQHVGPAATIQAAEAAVNEAAAHSFAAQDKTARSSSSSRPPASISGCALRVLTHVYAGEYSGGVEPRHVVAIFGLADAVANRHLAGYNNTNDGPYSDRGEYHGRQTDQMLASRPTELVDAMLGLVGSLDPGMAHLTLFYNAESVLDRTILGTPDCADAYADGSHLSKAHTLKCLISAPKADSQDKSLQAKLLEQGVDGRVMHVGLLQAWQPLARSPLPSPSPSASLQTPQMAGSDSRSRSRPLELHEYLTSAAALPPGCGCEGDGATTAAVPEADASAMTAAVLIAGGKARVVRNAAAEWTLPVQTLLTDAAAFKARLTAGLGGGDAALVGAKVRNATAGGSTRMTIADADEAAVGAAMFTSALADQSEDVFNVDQFSIVELSVAAVVDAVLLTDTRGGGVGTGRGPKDSDAGTGSKNAAAIKAKPVDECANDAVDALHNDAAGIVSYFTSLPVSMSPLFAAEESDASPLSGTGGAAQSNQYLWLSSAGVSTHTHFDQDHNIFLQLAGSKKVTLFPPGAHETLYPFPRLHPLWHKSKVVFANKTAFAAGGSGGRLFPGYVAALEAAQEVVLHPGDLLYIPPYTYVVPSLVPHPCELLYIPPHTHVFNCLG